MHASLLGPALALLAPGVNTHSSQPTTAQPSTTDPVASAAADWSSLDAELSALTGPGSWLADGEIDLEGFFRASYAHSGDIMVGTNDLGGFSLDNARLRATGGTGDFGVVVEVEASTDNLGAGSGRVGKGGAFRSGVFGGTGTGGSTMLLDGFIEWYYSEQITFTAGQFRPWTFHDTQQDPIDQMFIDRTFNAEWWAFRQSGAMVTYAEELYNVYVGVQNGGDGVGDELAYFVRGDYAAIGPQRDDIPGGYGSEERSLNVGAGFYNDDAPTDGDFFHVDGEYRDGPFTVVGEFGDYGASLIGGDGTVWSAAFAYMLTPDDWELALRWEDLDNFAGGAEIITAGVTHYRGSHDRKYQVNISQLDRDSSNDDTVIQVGMAMGF